MTCGSENHIQKMTSFKLRGQTALGLLLSFTPWISGHTSTGPGHTMSLYGKTDKAAGQKRAASTCLSFAGKACRLLDGCSRER